MPRSGARTAGAAAGSWRPWDVDRHASDRFFLQGVRCAAGHMGPALQGIPS